MSEGCGHAPSDTQWGFVDDLHEKQRECYEEHFPGHHEDPAYDAMVDGVVRQAQQMAGRLKDSAPHTTEERLELTYLRLADQALAKNRAYGDSALHPIGVFGSGRAKDAIGARIDDKISRFRNHHGAFGENDVEDLIGYLVLWLLADEDEKGEA